MKIALSYPKTTGVIVASTYRNLADFVIPMITRELWDAIGDETYWDTIIDRFNKKDNALYFNNGSEILFRSCDRPDDLRGPNLNWFAIDEASKVGPGVWRIMVGRARKYPEKGFITTTPRGRNWVYDEFARQKRKNYEYFTGATSENVNLSEDYLESLKESYTGSFLRQEFYGEFVGWEGLVYPDINLDTHHLDAPDPNDLGRYRYGVAGVDWGWTDPSVIEVGLVQTDEKIHMVDEFYQKKTPIDDIVKKAVELKRKWNISTFYCDSARPEYIQEFRNAGLDARKGYKEIDPGIAHVNKMIAQKTLQVDYNACPFMVNEFEMYHYDENDMGEILKDKPVDKDNHCMDSLRYLCYSQAKRGHASSRSTR